jgi:sugar (pentulose or hexulose) kinase
MGYYIGIDIGASFIKGALFELDQLKVTNIIKYSTPPSSLSSEDNQTAVRYEVNCDSYEKLVRKIISELLQIQGVIDGIVLSTQMHGMVLVDSHLKPLTPFIGWQDERMNEQSSKNMTWLDILNKKLSKIDVTKMGIQFRSGLMGSTLFWLKENGLLKKYNHGKALFLGDYIAAKLTHGALVTHSTNACGSGVFNVKENCWDKKIINTLGLEESFLPEVVSTARKVGYFKIKNKKIPVFVSFGDMQVAIVGSLVGLGGEKEFCINIGTGSQVSSVVERFNPGQYDIRSYFDDKYLRTITFIPAGRALNVMIKFIEDIGKKIFNRKDEDVWEKLTKLVINKKENIDLKADISYFKNSISDQVTGSFSNITEKNFRIDNMFFSILERMTDNYYLAYKRLGNTKITDKIICAGGLGRKLTPLHLLMKNKFKRTILPAPFEEETLVGLFILSLVCRGDFLTVKEASLFVQKNKLRFK